MSAKPFLDAFIEAQTWKEGHEKTVTDEMRRWVRDEHDRRYGKAPTEADIDAAVKGMGWTLVMCSEYGLDFEEVAVAAEMLMRVTRAQAQGLAGAEDDPIGLGVAAGFTSGLLTGLKFSQNRNGGAV